MKIFVLLLSTVLVTVFSATASLANCGSCAISTAQASEKAVMANNKYCPVTGEAIEKGHESDVTYEYNGKIYSFCCPMCPPLFKKDPEKYLKALEEKEKTGKDSSSMQPMNMGK